MECEKTVDQIKVTTPQPLRILITEYSLVSGLTDEQIAEIVKKTKGDKRFLSDEAELENFQDLETAKEWFLRKSIVYGLLSPDENPVGFAAMELETDPETNIQAHLWSFGLDSSIQNFGWAALMNLVWQRYTPRATAPGIRMRFQRIHADFGKGNTSRAESLARRFARSYGLKNIANTNGDVILLGTK